MSVKYVFALLLALSPIAASADEYDRYHPDQHYRRLGLEQFEAGNKAAAVPLLTRAARYADKPSQLALAMMYWTGNGVPQDRVLGYVWADIASERGYPDFVSVREGYWNDMTDAEQLKAADRGAPLQKEYGDTQAKKRLEGLLRQGLSRKTGTRTGSRVSSLATAQIDSSARANMLAVMSSTGLGNIVPGQDPNITATNQLKMFSQVVTAVSPRASTNYYSDVNWRPKAYWAYQDALWNEMVGVVTIKPITSDSRRTLKAEQ